MPAALIAGLTGKIGLYLAESLSQNGLGDYLLSLGREL